MSEVRPQPHHVRGVESLSRPIYRRGRRATAVKAYTIVHESTHLLVFGVPAINLKDELSKLIEPHGQAQIFKVNDYPELEPFTELFHLNFTKIGVTRAVKRRLDGLEFFGGILHVCYAPELETMEETRGKLIYRSRQLAAAATSGKKFKPS